MSALDIVPVVGGVASTIIGAVQANAANRPINYGKQYNQIMNSQLAWAPKVYAAHAQYDPAYAALDEQLMYQRLFGSPGQTMTEQYIKGYQSVPLIDPQTGKTLSIQSVPIYGTRTVQKDATRGMLDIYQKDISPALSAIQAQDERARVQGEIDTLNALGPQAKAAFDAANPEAAKLMAQLTSGANADLAAGSALRPDQARNVTQSYRQASAARGMSASPSAAWLEALKTSSAGQALEQSRRNWAGQVLQMNQNYYGDPRERFFGRSSGTPTGANFMGQGANGTRITVNDPMSAATSMANTTYNAGQNMAGFWNNQMVGAAGATMGALGRWLAPDPGPGQQQQANSF